MSGRTFWIGAAFTGAVAIAMGFDFAARVAPRRAPVLPAPEGFKMSLKDLGPVEVAFAGRVQLVADRREADTAGGATRIPRWKVGGSDPAPDGAGMAILDTDIEALAREEGDDRPLVAHSPRAWIPLKRDNGLLMMDLDRAWRLADPVLDLPGLRPGAGMTATARGMAVLHPREERVEAAGWFRLQAETLTLDAAGFSYDAASRVVRFEPWQGAVRWSFTDEAGRTLRGSSDAGGELAPLPDGGFRLALREGATGVRAALPAGPGLPPATVLARALDLRFAESGGGGWRPVAASARGPLLLSDARLALEGAGAEIGWNAAGALREARVAGPLAVLPWDPPLQAATARETAVYDAATGAVTLDGRAWAAHAGGTLAADALAWDGAQVRVAGGVIAHGPEGTAFADRAAAAEASGLAAEGGVRLRPADGMLKELAGPALRVDPRGEAALSEGFAAQGERAGAAWTLVGDRLVQRVTAEGARRAEATGALVWTEGGMRVEAERFQQLDERRFRLDGSPARGWIELDSGGRAEATFRRAESDQEKLRIEGEPWVRVPAAALGLAGENVELRARTASRTHADGAWLLEEDVRAAGALRTDADRASWSPVAGITLKRRTGSTTVEGVLEDGTTFRATADEFGIDAERRLHLLGHAHGHFVLPDGRLHEVQADRIEASEFGGIAEGKVIADSSFGHGRCDRAEWKVTDGRLTGLIAAGGARLERSDLVAEGDRIEMDEESGWIQMAGLPGRPAWLRRPDGREARGQEFGYNTRTLLLRGSGVRFEAPASPR